MTDNLLFKEFIVFLDNEDKEKCMKLILSSLADEQIDIVTLYNKVLAPSLNERTCTDKSGERCVWKEHIRTSIIRTIIECCYPYTMKEKTAKFGDNFKGNVIIACPQEEYHELGARMVADFFTLCGYLSAFVGANTPLSEILNAIKYARPAYVGISVTNCFNLVVAQKIVKSVVELRNMENLEYKIIVGGNAFKRNPELYKEIGADYFLDTFEEIKKLTE